MKVIRYFRSKLLAVLLTSAAVTMCITLYTGDRKSTKRTKLMEEEKKLWFHEFARKHQPDPTRVHLSLSYLKLPEFLKDFRNPCYRDEPVSQNIYCVPYAYQLGFAKSGTTFLRTILGSHPLSLPHVVTDSYRFVINKNYKKKRGKQELSDFTARTYVDLAYDTVTKAIIRTTDPTDMSVSAKDYGAHAVNTDTFIKYHFDFLKRFPEESAAILRKAQKRHKYPAIAVDITLADFWQLNLWKELEENQEEDGGVPNHNVCELMKKINPNAKIYVIMREPISRLFSWYTYTRKISGMKPDMAKFHEDALECTKTINDCLASERPDTLCTNYDDSDGILRGFSDTMYYYRIRDCARHIPLSNFLFIKFEEFTSDAEKSIRQLYDFFGLPPLSEEAISFIKDVVPVNAQKDKVQEDGMWPETRSLLNTFFKPYNEKLASLLKDRRYLWED